MKKFFQRLIILFIIFSSIFPQLAQAYQVVGFDNFSKEILYNLDTFKDINYSDWYYENVKSVYEYGLMSGHGDGIFGPNNNITIAELITLSSRIFGLYYDGYVPYFETLPDESWFDPYVSYAKDNSIIDIDISDYNKNATRAEFAKIIVNTVNKLEFEEINQIDDNAIPDVKLDSDYSDAVYMLYKAGVLVGSDEYGTFNPNSPITRAEVATIVTRIIDSNLRQTIELYGEY